MADQSVTTVQLHPELVVVQVLPETVDERNLGTIRDRVAAAGAEWPNLPVAVDMSRVQFLPSLSLAGLIQLSQLFRTRKQRLVLACLQPAVRETLVLTRLDRLFEIQRDLSELMNQPK